MKIFRVGIIALTFILLSSLVYAGPKGKGKSTEKSSATERVTKKTEEAVKDVLTGEDAKAKSTKSGTPPGLAKKEKMPSGLEKKGKTPSGWSKGKKVGWNKGSRKK